MSNFLFCQFCAKFENSKWPPFLEEEKIFKMGHIRLQKFLWTNNSDEIALSRTVKEIWEILCFATFAKNSKWPPFLEREEKFLIGAEYLAKVPLGPNILTKNILWKIQKFKMAAIFWKNDNFFKIGESILLRYSAVKNFAKIALSHTVEEIAIMLVKNCFCLISH